MWGEPVILRECRTKQQHRWWVNIPSSPVLRFAPSTITTRSLPTVAVLLAVAVHINDIRITPPHTHSSALQQSYVINRQQTRTTAVPEMWNCYWNKRKKKPVKWEVNVECAATLKQRTWQEAMKSAEKWQWQVEITKTDTAFTFATHGHLN